ncbi:MAG: peptidoglycan D,D-transpeptidase FtsI family protein [Candidatus Dojkabacteria bacterium]
MGNKKLIQNKLRFFTFAQVVAFLFVAGFLFRWQILEHDRFQAQAESRVISSEIQGLRGDILAADGSVLAYSEPRFDIYVFMNDKFGLLAAEEGGRQTRAEFVTKVAAELEISEQDLEDKLAQEKQWIQIAEAVTKKQRDAILSIPTNRDEQVHLTGLDYVETSVRRYPEGELAAHVLGFVGRDEFGNTVGVNGLEQYFDGLLRPQSGISSLEQDSNSNLIAISSNVLREARRGASIHTTIDKNIQSKVQEQLETAVENFQARSATVIVADPRTGEIKAMANYPSYNPEDYFKTEDQSVLGNTAITNPYEIGSVGKIYTMAAAVDQGKVTPNTVVIDGHDGCEEIIEQRIICTYDKKPQGPLTATDAMIKSDNLAFFHTAQLVSDKVLADYLQSFGLGNRTRIQLSGEDEGFIKPGENWNEADLAAYSYGHSYFQTTLQAVMGVSALANGGKLMEPTIVRKIEDVTGQTREYKPLMKREVMKPENVEIMDQILHDVYLNNLYENRYKHLEEYDIAMKSGTALIPYTALTPPISRPGYSNEVNSTYIGYDASDKNSFIMLVNVSEPQTTPKLSYANARLLWLDTFDEIRNDLGVPKK